MSACSQIQHQFSRYLDGDVPGTRMLEIAGPPGKVRRLRPRVCRLAAESGAGLDPRPRQGPGRPRAAAPRRHLAGEPQFRARAAQPLSHSLGKHLPAVPASGCRGFASAIFLVGTAAMLIGTFASPEAVEARDQPLESSTRAAPCSTPLSSPRTLSATITIPWCCRSLSTAMAASTTTRSSPARWT